MFGGWTWHRQSNRPAGVSQEQQHFDWAHSYSTGKLFAGGVVDVTAPSFLMVRSIIESKKRTGSVWRKHTHQHSPPLSDSSTRNVDDHMPCAFSSVVMLPSPESTALSIEAQVSS